MATPHGRGLRPGGVVGALGRLALLVVLGFGVGLVFGVVIEEPELLAGHLRGESEPVVLEASTAPPDRTSAIAADATVPSSRPTVSRPPVTAQERAVSIRLPEVSAEGPDLGGPAPPVARASGPGTSPAAASPVSSAGAVPGSARPPQGGEPRWAIQVGAFSEQASARRLAEGLRSRYPVAVLPVDAGGRWRVRVQPIEGKAAARDLAERLKRDQRLPTWVMPMEGRSGS